MGLNPFGGNIWGRTRVFQCCVFSLPVINTRSLLHHPLFLMYFVNIAEWQDANIFWISKQASKGMKNISFSQSLSCFLKLFSPTPFLSIFGFWSTFMVWDQDISHYLPPTSSCSLLGALLRLEFTCLWWQSSSWCSHDCPPHLLNKHWGVGDWEEVMLISKAISLLGFTQKYCHNALGRVWNPIGLL